MKTLELKHIAPYLPYELNGFIVRGKNRFEVEVVGWNYSTLKTRPSIHGMASCEFKFFKPILRPLSDLTKEQKEEIGGMLFNYSISGTDAQTEAEDWIRNDMSPTMSLNKCVDVCEYLFSIHADVHNLIPSGLAVNIKTLNKQ